MGSRHLFGAAGAIPGKIDQKSLIRCEIIEYRGEEARFGRRLSQVLRAKARDGKEAFQPIVVGREPAERLYGGLRRGLCARGWRGFLNGRHR